MAKPETLLERKKRHIKSKYGLTWEDYLEMYNSQEGKCSICNEFISIEIGSKNKAHVDHCHISLKNRALLCGNCNKAIGLLQDNPEICFSAAKYLLKHQPSL